MSSPPPYSASSPSEGRLDHIRNGLVDILKTEEGSKELERGTEELTDSALAVEGYFRDVADGFCETEKKLHAEPQHSALVTMRKRWTAYQKEYKRLLWLSRNVAGKAHATIYDFVENILYVVDLPDTKMSFKVKKVEVDAYVKKLNDDQSCSHTDLADGFESLQENIISFQSDFTAFLKDFWNSRMLHCSDFVDQASIKKAQMSVKGMNLAVIALVIGSGATLLASEAISPSKIVAATGVVVLIGGSLTFMDYKERDHLEALVENEEPSIQLGKVAAVLPYLVRSMVDIAGRLVVFQSVGMAIANELLEIQNLMPPPEGLFHNPALSKRLTDVKLICQALKPALRRYQTTTNMNWTQPPPPYSSD